MNSSNPPVGEKKTRFVIAGGGTGGHVFPAIAIAEELCGRSGKNEVLFVGTQRGLESREVPKRGFSISFIDVRGLKGKTMGTTMKNLFFLPLSVVQSLNILRVFRPHAVIGVGGYASGPVVFAAFLLKITTAVTEQNAEPGFTNRILARIADRVFVSFPSTASFLPTNKVMVTGNPVRREFLEQGKVKRSGGDAFLNLLIFGGSQGARRINDAAIEALHELSDFAERIRIIHQTGMQDEKRVRDAYLTFRIDAKIVSFIDDMADAYRWADLVICRAGATTVAELTAAGKAAVMIPYPYAVGDHQRSNARVLEEAKAALVIPDGDFDGMRFASVVKDFLAQPSRIAAMSSASRQLGNPHAASDIADECIALTERKRK